MQYKMYHEAYNGRFKMFIQLEIFFHIQATLCRHRDATFMSSGNVCRVI